MSIEITMSADKDALLLAMCDKLPPMGEVFTTGDQERWLNAMSAILAFLYAPTWAQDAREKAKEARSDRVEAIRTTVTMDPVVARLKESWSRPFGPALPETVVVFPPMTEVSGDGYARKGDAFEVTFDRRSLLEEASSTTFAGVVDDESGGEASDDSGAGPAADTSAPAATPGTEPSTPSTASPAPANARKNFTADQKGAIIKRAVRSDVASVAVEVGIHETTLRRWMREMPVSVQTFEDELAAERLEAEAQPTVEELEAEQQAPIPDDIMRRATELAAKPAVQWPTAPIERRPFDPERARGHQANQ